MGFWDWVGTVAMIWLAVSILAAGLWALAGRRIFRKPPAPQMSERAANAIVDFARYDAEMRGRS